MTACYSNIIRPLATTSIKDNSHYETLDVPETASQDEIRTAYLEKIRQYHPDSNPDDAAANEKFLAVQDAYKTLGNEEDRKNYDCGVTDEPTHKPEHVTLTKEELEAQQKFWADHLKKSDEKMKVEKNVRKKRFGVSVYLVALVLVTYWGVDKYIEYRRFPYYDTLEGCPCENCKRKARGEGSSKWSLFR